MNKKEESELFKLLVDIRDGISTIATFLTEDLKHRQMVRQMEFESAKSNKDMLEFQRQAAEKTMALMSNPNLEEYLGSLRTWVQNMGPDAMRKMTDTAYEHTKMMTKDREAFQDQIKGVQGFNWGSHTVNLDTNEYLDSDGKWKKINKDELNKP